MAHEIAKVMLEQAVTFLDREQAVALAIRLGMPLNEIEDYLDWLDCMSDPPTDAGDGDHQEN